MILIREMLSRRVPHVLGAWVGLTWGLTQFFGFLSDRYGLDGVFIDLVLLAGLLLLPAAGWCAWRIGADGPVQWRRRDGLLIGGNLVLTAAAAGWLLMLADSQPAISDVATAPAADAGEPAITLAAPQPRSGPSLMVAPVQADGTVEQQQLDELSLLIALDLGQDEDLRTYSPYLGDHLFSALAREGDPLRPPLGLLTKVARLQGAKHLVTGKLSRRSESEISAELTLFELDPTRERQRFVASGQTLTALADQLSADIRQALDSKTSEHDDLPVTALSSEDAEARSLFTQAMVARFLHRDTQTATHLLQQAVARDDGFALAHLRLADHQIAQGRWQDATESIKRADQRSWSLTRETRAGLRVVAESMRQPPDPGAVNRAYAQWIEQFPGSAAPRIGLLRRGMYEDQALDVSLQEIDAILAVAEQASEFSQLIELLRALDQGPQALKVARMGLERFPESMTLQSSLALLLADAGLHDEAEEILARQIVEHPSLTAPLIQMAELQADLGDDDAVQQWFERTLQVARDDIQHYMVLSARIRYFQEIGRTAAALDDLARLESLKNLQTAAPMEQFRQLWQLAGLIALRDGRDVTLQRFSALAEGSDPFFITWCAEVAPFIIDLALRDIETLKQSLPIAEAWLAQQAEQAQVEVSVLYGQLVMLAAEGEREVAYTTLTERLDALEHAVRTLRLAPIFRDQSRDLAAGAALATQRWDQAATAFEHRLRAKPGRLGTLIYQAELQHGRDELESARVTLQRIDQILADADPESTAVKLRDELRQRMDER